jgi:hypothetical protein
MTFAPATVSLTTRVEHTSRRGWTAGTDADGALVVVRPCDGARWYPSLDAEIEASHSENLWARLIEIARHQPDRGIWTE